MAVKIKLMRLGKIRSPFYRIVVSDARTRRSGRAIETIGKYHPKTDPSFIEVDSDRAQYWLGVGAQPTEPVLNILKITGDWQKFKGLPGAEGTLRHPAPPVNKLERFNAALAEAGGDTTGEATTAKKKKAEPKKSDDGSGAKAEKAEKPAKAEKVEEKPAKADAKAEKVEEKPAKADAKAEKVEKVDDKAGADQAEAPAADGGQ